MKMYEIIAHIENNRVESKIGFAIVNITPELAKIMLENNTSNRSVRTALVNKLSNYMTEGTWKLNGEPIVIREDGTIANGQHRLLAIIKSGVSVKCVVIWGIATEDSYTYDSGAARRVADSAKIMQLTGYLNSDKMYTNPVVIDSARLLIALRSAKKTYGENVEPWHMDNCTRFIPIETIISYITDNKDAFGFIYEWSSKARMSGLRKRCIWAAIAAAYLSNYDIQLLSEFCKQFTSGASVNKEIIYMRDYVTSIKSSSNNRLNFDIYMKMQKILNDFENGKNITRIRANGKESYANY